MKRKLVVCPECGYDNRLTSKAKGDRIREGILKSQRLGNHIGRPRKFDYETIKVLREKGLSYSQISRYLGGANRWSVRYACKRVLEKVE